MKTMARRKRNDTQLTWPKWILGSAIVVGGIVGANYGVHRFLNRGLPRWKYCIRGFGGISTDVGYEVVITDPSGMSAILRITESDGRPAITTWWAARNSARDYVICRGGVPVHSSDPCPSTSVVLEDACTTE